MKKKKQIKKLKAKVKALELRLSETQQKTGDVPSNPNSIIGPGTSLTEFLEKTGQAGIQSEDLQRFVCGDPYKQPQGGSNPRSMAQIIDMCTELKNQSLKEIVRNTNALPSISKQQRDAEIKDILKKTEENCKNPVAL